MPQLLHPKTKTYGFLGSMTVLALALSACSSHSQNDSPSPASSDSETASSASATPSESATSASTQAAEATDEPDIRGFEEELNFEGSFENFIQATEDAPAQNVPKPIEPEGMNEHSEQGFFRFIDYYMAERNYAVTSGDTERWRQLVTPEGQPNAMQQAEIEFIDQVDAAYENGGWVVDGHREQAIDKFIFKQLDNGDYSYESYAVENGTIVLNPEGNPPRMQWAPVTQDAYYYALKATYENDRWVLGGITADFEETIPREG